MFVFIFQSAKVLFDPFCSQIHYMKKDKWQKKKKEHK